MAPNDPSNVPKKQAIMIIVNPLIKVMALTDHSFIVPGPPKKGGGSYQVTDNQLTAILFV